MVRGLDLVSLLRISKKARASFFFIWIVEKKHNLRHFVIKHVKTKLYWYNFLSKMSAFSQLEITNYFLGKYRFVMLMWLQFFFWKETAASCWCSCTFLFEIVCYIMLVKWYFSFWKRLRNHVYVAVFVHSKEIATLLCWCSEAFFR